MSFSYRFPFNGISPYFIYFLLLILIFSYLFISVFTNLCSCFPLVILPPLFLSFLLPSISVKYYWKLTFICHCKGLQLEEKRNDLQGLMFFLISVLWFFLCFYFCRRKGRRNFHNEHLFISEVRKEWKSISIIIEEKLSIELQKM